MEPPNEGHQFRQNPISEVSPLSKVSLSILDLKGMESSNHIVRWTQSSKDYKEAQIAFSKQKEEEVAEVIWATSSRRQFLLKLKAKYAGKRLVLVLYNGYFIIDNTVDGQKISKEIICPDSQRISEDKDASP